MLNSVGSGTQADGYNTVMRSILMVVAAAALVLLSACGPRAGLGTVPTATLFLITSTLPSRPTARPSETQPPPTIAPTPVPVDGTTTSQLNVRGGPSTDYPVLGSLGIFTKVKVLGRDATGDWYQISFADSSEGVAWITGAYVQLDGNPELSVITPATTAVSTSSSSNLGTPAATALAPLTPATTRPMPTIVATAVADEDSASAPAVSVIFSPEGARSLQYTGDVSSPEGDSEDWIQFTVYGKAGQPAAAEVKLDCSGNAALRLELLQAGSMLQSWDNLGCATRTRLLLSLFGGPPYLLRLQPSAGAAGPSYVRFTVTVEASGL